MKSIEYFIQANQMLIDGIEQARKEAAGLAEDEPVDDKYEGVNLEDDKYDHRLMPE